MTRLTNRVMIGQQVFQDNTGYMTFNFWRQIFSMFLVLLTGLSAMAQTNISGIVNDYASVKSATGTEVKVANAAAIATYSVGDKILLIQMKGTTISEANDATYGDIISFEGAGNYEFNEIAAISGVTITVRFPLCKEYITALHPVQVIRVPVYSNATVVGDITGQPWDGATGGVIAFEVLGTLTLNADINAESLGFRGGDVSTNALAADASLYVCDISTGEGGIKGEGIIAIPDAACRGKLANGGGGGNDHNSGGGGGGNFGSGGIGGDGWSNPDGIEAGQGGVGGLTLAQYYTVGLPKLFLGGGGGGGHQNNGASAPGSNGGGIIIIQADVIDAGAAASKISAKALDAVDITINDGAGGGGSGGSVLLEVNTYLNTSNLTIDVSGGDGGSVTTANGHGPGGGGGGGFIHAKTAIAGTVTTVITGGDPGIFYSTGSASTSGTSRNAASGAEGAILQGNLSIQNCSNPPDLDLDDTNAGTGFSTIFNVLQSGISIANSGQVNITDIDNIQMEIAEIALTNALNGGDESLYVDDAAMILATYGIAVTFSTDGHTVYLNGKSAIANYETVLGLIKYSNVNSVPDASPRLVEVFVNDGGASSATAVTTITLNFPPTVDIQNEPASVNAVTPYNVTIEFNEDVTGFAEGDIVVVNGATSNFVVVDGNTYTVDITPNGTGNITIDVAAGVAQDSNNNDNIKAAQAVTVYDAIAATVDIQGEPTSVNDKTAYSVTFKFSEDVTGFVIGDIIVGNGTVGNFVAVDGNTYTADITPDGNGNITIDVPSGSAQDLATNDNIAAAQALTIYDSNPTVAFNTATSNGGESVSSAAIAVALSETTGLDVTVNYFVTGTAAAGTDYTLADGMITIPSGSTGANITIASIVEDLLDENDETVIVTLSNPVNATIGANTIHTYTIIDNDNSPVITAADASIPEGVTTVETATATDGDAGDSQTYSIAGIDAALFDIDPSTGELTFKAAPDFENPLDDGADNIYDLDMMVTDTGGNSDTQSIQVTVTGINDINPVLSANGGTIPEGTTTVETATATDGDAGDSQTYSISGIDAALFDIDPSTGELTFKAAPDFENPLDDGIDNVYDLDVTVTDTGGNSDTQSIQVTVTGVNDNNPVITVTSRIFIPEGSANVVTVLVADADSGDTKSFSLSGLDAAIFDINPATGVITFRNAADFENPLDNNADNVYQFIVTVSDAAGNTDTQLLEITVMPVNDNDPILSAMDVTVAEGSTIVQTVSASDADAGDTQTFSITGTDAALFAINPTSGALTFKSVPVFGDPKDNGGNNVYDLDVVVTDSNGNRDSQSIQVTVTGEINELPVANNDDVAVDENSSISGIDLLSNDSDPDLDLLTINTTPVVAAAHGTLVINLNGTISYTPDAEYFGGDSFTYEVCDSRGGCATAMVTITINEVNTDFDDDGIPNDEEGNGDTDNDGIPDNEDTDSDNDGLPDEQEGAGDADRDGIPDYKDEDSDNDGIPDSVEGDIDTDGDGIPDYLDQDADNDGIPDYEEIGTDLFSDCDNDGLPNYLDTDRCGVLASKGYSPNGDGENDFWLIEGINSYPNNQVKVFNRWGNLIFQGEGYNNENIAWIGQSVGAFVLGEPEVPDGTYFYVIDLGTGKDPLSGYIVLKR